MFFRFTFVNANLNIRNILSFFFGTDVELVIVEVLTTVKTKTVFTNDATYLVDSYQRIGKTCCLHLQGQLSTIYQTTWRNTPEVVIITVGLKCIILTELQAIRMFHSRIWEHFYLIQYTTRCCLFHCSSPNSMRVCIRAMQETCTQNCSQRS